MAYWTTSEEDKPVYHTHEDCPEGEKILEKNREDGSPPGDRELCEVCADLGGQATSWRSAEGAG